MKRPNAPFASLVWLAGLVLTISTGCGSVVDDGPELGEIRVLNLSQAAPALEAFIDSVKPPGASPIGFGQSTNYIEVEVGPRTVDIGSTGAASSAELNVGIVEVAAGKTTVVAFDNFDSVQSISFPDNETAIAAGNVRVRAIHAAPGVGSIDLLTVESQTETPFASNLGFGSFSGEVDILAGSLTIGADLDADGASEIYFEFPDLLEGTVANVYITETESAEVVAYAQQSGSTTTQFLPATSSVRVVHASRSTGAVDVRIDEGNGFSDVSFASASSAIELQSGRHSFETILRGTNQVAFSLPDVLLRPGNHTLVVFGDSDSVGPTALQGVVIADDDRDVATGELRLQIFHAAPTIEEGDIYSLNEAGGVDEQLVPDLGFGGFGSAPDLLRAPYPLGFEANSSGLIVADFEVPSLVVSAANVFIIQDTANAVYLLAQLTGDSTALVCETGVSPCMLPGPP